MCREVAHPPTPGVIYSLFLGFGISIGAEFWIKFTGQSVGAGNLTSCVGMLTLRKIKGTAQYDCYDAHHDAPWYQVTPSPYWCTYSPIHGGLR